MARSRAWIVGVGTLLGVLATGLARTAGFYGVGTSLRGVDGNSLCWGVSPNGQVAAGTFSPSGPPYGSEGFTWSLSTGMVALGDLPGDAYLYEPRAASNAGEVVVGFGSGPWDQYHAVYATAAGVVDLEDPDEFYTRSGAEDVSNDGRVIVGFSDEVGARAFRWTEATGMVFLSEAHSSAQGVSADGSVVVGVANSQAFRWTQGTGTVGLGCFPGEARSYACDTSADGTVVAGHGSRRLDKYNTTDEAFVWTEEEGIVGLGYLGVAPEFVPFSEAKDISGDGRVIIGQSCTAAGLEVPFIWDAAHGMRSLPDVLVNEYGLDLSGWRAYRATGISDDGLTIVGYGYGPSGHRQGWVAVIAEPASMALLALGALGLLRRPKRR